MTFYWERDGNGYKVYAEQWDMSEEAVVVDDITDGLGIGNKEAGSFSTFKVFDYSEGQIYAHDLTERPVNVSVYTVSR